MGGIEKNVLITTDFRFIFIPGFSNFGIDGTAIALDMSLDNTKDLKNLLVKPIANDLVMGLMLLPLLRN